MVRPIQDSFLTNPTLQAQRDPDEEGEYMAFEQLMAEAAAKKGKDDKKGRKGKKDEAQPATDHSRHHHTHHHHVHEKGPGVRSA